MWIIGAYTFLQWLGTRRRAFLGRDESAAANTGE